MFVYLRALYFDCLPVIEHCRKCPANYVIRASLCVVLIWWLCVVVVLRGKASVFADNASVSCLTVYVYVSK